MGSRYQDFTTAFTRIGIRLQIPFLTFQHINVSTYLVSGLHDRFYEERDPAPDPVPHGSTYQRINVLGIRTIRPLLRRSGSGSRSRSTRFNVSTFQRINISTYQRINLSRLNHREASLLRCDVRVTGDQTSFPLRKPSFLVSAALSLMSERCFR